MDQLVEFLFCALKLFFWKGLSIGKRKTKNDKKTFMYQAVDGGIHLFLNFAASEYCVVLMEVGGTHKIR